LLTAIAAFAEKFANPVALALVLSLAFLLPRPGQLRLAAALLGLVLALPELVPLPPLAEAALTGLGAMAATLLHAELALFFVLPACRLAQRLLKASWQLMAEVAAIILDEGRERPAGGSAAPRPTSAPGEPKQPPGPPAGQA
jgi:hypothetical protein